VQITNQFGCVLDASTEVILRQTPVFSLGEDFALCVGDQGRIGPDVDLSDFNLVWSNGNSTTEIIVTSQGTYTLTASSEYCEYSDEIFVNFSFPPRNNLLDEKPHCFDECGALELNAGNEQNEVVWSNGFVGSILTVEEVGSYTAEISTPEGCVRSYTTEVIEECRGGNVYVPNSFTPDGDGLNDIFKVAYPADIEDFRLEIYNRWGELVFATDSPEQGWDGNSGNGEYFAQSELFVYQLTYKYFNTCDEYDWDVYEGTGSIMLLR